jgi:hypothetical protein
MHRGSKDLEWSMERVWPRSEARSLARPLVFPLPYSGPAPERDHPKVCVANPVISEKMEKTDEKH